MALDPYCTFGPYANSRDWYSTTYANASSPACRDGLAIRNFVTTALVIGTYIVDRSHPNSSLVASYREIDLKRKNDVVRRYRNVDSDHPSPTYLYLFLPLESSFVPYPSS